MVHANELTIDDITEQLAPDDPDPKLIAMLFCDQVIRDAKTRKASIIGIYNKVTSDQVPCRLPPTALFISLANVRRPFRLSLEVAKVGVEGPPEELLQFACPNTDVEQMMETGISLGSLEFAEAGKYVFRIVSGGRVIGERPIEVNLIEKQPEESE